MSGYCTEACHAKRQAQQPSDDWPRAARAVRQCRWTFSPDHQWQMKVSIRMLIWSCIQRSGKTNLIGGNYCKAILFRVPIFVRGSWNVMEKYRRWVLLNLYTGRVVSTLYTSSSDAWTKSAHKLHGATASYSQKLRDYPFRNGTIHDFSTGSRLKTGAVDLFGCQGCCFLAVLRWSTKRSKVLLMVMGDGW